MPHLNLVVLAGHLTRDPEVTYTASGFAIANLGMATNNRVKKSDEWVDEPVFVDVVVFGKSAEYVGENADKGTAVLVNGKLKFEQWEDKSTRQKRSKLKVVADHVQVLGKSGSGSKSIEDDDDVPF